MKNMHSIHTPGEIGQNEYQTPLSFVSCVKDAYGLEILRDI
jgi:hypothetical protein